MRKGVMGLLFISVGLAFSQAAFSTEMIRYEHDLHHNKATNHKVHQQGASHTQGTDRKTSGQKLQKKQSNSDAYQGARPNYYKDDSANSRNAARHGVREKN
ncbi:hypothetical protein CC99x_001795 [Candidatus Berkiella cookevillensis]|uniref:Uncharacterized protein n=1 Tax=Candidatus Berkiella cookevillensis TaxID=437022 RepID=A0A0Q9YPN5_9GAMM|nr:hypothetical protein [Candidatus Berkiella cookevillensis]MCS5707631.1 hypothetical protein [Candidatus Berkiella cookevillensis]